MGYPQQQISNTKSSTLQTFINFMFAHSVSRQCIHVQYSKYQCWEFLRIFIISHLNTFIDNNTCMYVKKIEIVIIIHPPK